MTDIILNNECDIQFFDNDVVLGVSDNQHQELLLVCYKGEFKESPLATVGIVNYLRDNNIAEMLHEVRTRFVNDGMTISRMSFNENVNEIDYVASYKE